MRCQYVAFSDSICSRALATRARILHGNAEGAVIEADQRFSTVNELVIVYVDVDHSPGDVRADRHLSRAKVGVISRFITSASQVRVEGCGSRNERHAYHERHTEALP